MSTIGAGASILVQRDPFRMSFGDGDAREVLTHVARSEPVVQKVTFDEPIRRAG